MTLAIPLRAVYGLKDFITARHLDNCAKLMLVTGLIVAYGYSSEIFLAWLSGNEFEWYMTTNRMGGAYGPAFWALILCNVIIPQSLWFKRVRVNPKTLWIVSLVINVGMWLERYVIVITSLHRDFLTSSWDMYYPTIYDWATFIGSIGLFLALLFLFIRFLPMISAFEMRELISRTHGDPSVGDSEPATVQEAKSI